MKAEDNTLRLVPCEACGQTGWLGGNSGVEYSDPDIIGLPPFCDCCRGRGYISYPELQSYREKIRKENIWLYKHLEKDIERAVDEYFKEHDL